MARASKKSFVDDLDRAGSRRVATAIIEGRQPIDVAPKSHGKKARGKVTGILPVEKSREEITDILPVIKSQEKSTGKIHVVKARENRNRRIELNVTPSAFDRLKSEAAEAGESINETINQIIEIYFREKASDQ